jgi:hypothetical protein
MGDTSETLLELQNRQDAEEYARDRLLGGRYLNVVEELHWIMNNIDCFIGQSQRKHQRSVCGSVCGIRRT